MSNDSFIPKIKLVDPTDCTCSKADLQDFEFCLCGAVNPPSNLGNYDPLDDCSVLMINPPYT